MQRQTAMYPAYAEVDSFLAGNSEALYARFVDVAKTSADRARVFVRLEPYAVDRRSWIQLQESTGTKLDDVFPGCIQVVYWIEEVTALWR